MLREDDVFMAFLFILVIAFGFFIQILKIV